MECEPSVECSVQSLKKTGEQSAEEIIEKLQPDICDFLIHICHSAESLNSGKIR